MNNVIVIIRSAGERTEQLCKKLVLEQGVPEAQVVIVQEVPFSAAMRKSFELGLESGLKYTFCVDADVLLRPGSIAYMIEQFDKQPETVCEMQGLVLDKFFGGSRPGGTHVYRSSLLPDVLKRIPQEGINIRPEYHTLLAMSNDGFPWAETPYIVGTHDDEQFNIDIYRKCFVQAIKHTHMADLFSEVWKINTEKDADFGVALRAFADGFQYQDTLYINKNQTVYKEGFAKTGFHEKGELDISNIDLDTIENRILNWEDHPAFLVKFPARFGLNNSNEPAVETGVMDDAAEPLSFAAEPGVILIDDNGLYQKIKRKISQKGLIKFIVFVTAKLLVAIGNRLYKISS